MKKVLLLSLSLLMPGFAHAESDREKPAPNEVVKEKAPEAAPKEISPVFDKSRADDVIKAVNTVVRETGAGSKDIVKGLRSALDVRLPIVLEACDVKISHEILRIAYGVVTDAPDSARVLRDLASDFARREMPDFKGVTNDCAVSLKGLGVAVTKVYLGKNGATNNRTVISNKQFNY